MCGIFVRELWFSFILYEKFKVNELQRINVKEKRKQAKPQQSGLSRGFESF